MKQTKYLMSSFIFIEPVHFNLSLPLQQRHSSELDVDVIDALVEEVSSPLGNLMNTNPFTTGSTRLNRSHFLRQTGKDFIQLLEFSAETRNMTYH